MSDTNPLAMYLRAVHRADGLVVTERDMELFEASDEFKRWEAQAIKEAEEYWRKVLKLEDSNG